MPQPLKNQQNFAVTIAKGEKTSSEIQIGGFGAGSFKIPTGFTTPVSVTYTGSEKYGGTYSKVVNGTPEPIATPLASSGWHEFPSALFGLHSVKLVANAAQAAKRTLDVSVHT